LVGSLATAEAYHVVAQHRLAGSGQSATTNDQVNVGRAHDPDSSAGDRTRHDYGRNLLV
jgi:hypothetical protein